MSPVIITWVPWEAIPATLVVALMLPRAARFLVGLVRRLES